MFNTSELVEQNELFEGESNENYSDFDDSDWFDSEDFNLPESENDF